MKETEKETGINWADYFYYDETSPTGLRWKVDRYAGYHGLSLMAKAGSPAGHKVFRKCGKPKGYRIHVADKRASSVSLVIYDLLGIEVPKGYVIDHLDGNPFNNSIENLALKTSKANSQNLSKATNNTSGFTGVVWMTTRKKLKTYARSFIWKIVDGKQKVSFKYFAVHKYGLLPAFLMACEWRVAKLKELNEAGEQFTLRSYNA